MAEGVKTKSIWSSFLGFFRHIEGISLPVLILYLVFVGLSLYSVTTASGSETYETFFRGSLGLPFLKHYIIVFFGAFLVAVLLAIRAKYLQTFGVFGYCLLCFILIVWLLVQGSDSKINDANRWIHVFGISVQPSEFVKLGVIFLMSTTSARFLQNGNMSRLSYTLYYGIPILVLMGVIAVFGYSNISTALIYFISVIVLYFVYMMPLRWYLSTFSAIVLFLGAFVVAQVYVVPEELQIGRFSTVKARLERKVDEGEHNKFEINDKNRQEQFARIALANSNYSGRGIGQSKIKDILPMAMSDYIYAVLIEEGGVFAMILIPLLYVLWLFLAYRMGSREPNLFYKFVLYGIGFLYPFQAFVNIVVVSGIITTGQPLPFLSAGGSSFWANSFAFAVMLIISREQKERIRRHEEHKLAELA